MAASAPIQTEKGTKGWRLRHPNIDGHIDGTAARRGQDLPVSGIIQVEVVDNVTNGVCNSGIWAVVFQRMRTISLQGSRGFGFAITGLVLSGQM